MKPGPKFDNEKIDQMIAEVRIFRVFEQGYSRTENGTFIPAGKLKYYEVRGGGFLPLQRGTFKKAKEEVLTRINILKKMKTMVELPIVDQN